MDDYAEIYLDESGDLGWKFDSPYRQGGSSRFLTIGAVVAPDDMSKTLTRLIADLYRTRSWSPAKEKKWSRMIPSARVDFATRAASLSNKHAKLSYHSITVRKSRVWNHIRADANKLYNFMIKEMLLGDMKRFKRVLFIPDDRSIKVRSGSSLHDYLQTELWFTENVTTKLTTRPSESAEFPQLQFTDMLSGLVQFHFEDADSEPFNILSPLMTVKRLFF